MATASRSSATSTTSGFFDSSALSSLLFSPRLQRAATGATTATTTTQKQQQRALYQAEYRRFYYAQKSSTGDDDPDQHVGLFEQSLDVYMPILNDDDNDDLPPMANVVVALVVGSGWMGHRAMVYTATSWWNSSGPTSLAQVGCVCVCIRHRGAFPMMMPTWSFVQQALAFLLRVVVVVTVVAAALVLLIVFFLTTDHIAAGVVETTNDAVPTNIAAATLLSRLFQQQQHDSCVSSSSFSRTVMAVLQNAADYFSNSTNNEDTWIMPDTATTALCLFLLAVVGASFIGMRHGSATLNDMLDDVATAMVWIQNNPQHLVVAKRSSRQRHDDDNGQRLNEKDTADSFTTRTTATHRPLFLLGGYSSGGHVAATLLQRPDIWQRHGLPCPQACLDGALFVSGVMAVHDNDDSSAKNRIGVGLTNLVKYMAFGGGGGGGDNNSITMNESPLPCPLHNVSSSPRIPHLLIGCAHELPFGLPWLDIFFRSPDYTHQLQHKLNVPARYIELPSRMNLNNHWTILASNDLKRALVQGLAWLAEQQQQQEDNTTMTSNDNNKYDMKKKKNMVQLHVDDEDTSQQPDAILDDSSFSEE